VDFNGFNAKPIEAVDIDIKYYEKRYLNEGKTG